MAASEVSRRDLTDEDVRAIVQGEVAEHRAAAHVFAEHDSARAEGHLRAAALLERVLV